MYVSHSAIMDHHICLHSQLWTVYSHQKNYFRSLVGRTRRLQWPWWVLPSTTEATIGCTRCMVHHIVLQDPPEEHGTVSRCRRRSQGARSNMRHGDQISHFSREKKSTARQKFNGISLYWSQAMIRSIYHMGILSGHKYLYRYYTRSTYALICSLESLAC